MKKKAVILSLLSVIAVFSVQAVDWASIVKNYGSAVARISLYDGKGAVISSGTGFMIETGPGVLRMVTNAHVAADAEHNSAFRLTAEFLFPDGGGKKYPLEIDVIDRKQDLCLLKLDGDPPGLLSIAADPEPVLMEEILIIGYPFGKNFKTTPGYIQAFQDIDGTGRMLDLSATAAPGNSGGPVLNSNGRVIGVITSIIPGYNFNLAIPAANLVSMIGRDSGKSEISIYSEPEQAWVFIDGDYRGKTPINLELYSREYQLTVEKEGFVTYKEKIGPWDGESSTEVRAILQAPVDTNPEIEIVAVPDNAAININNDEMDSMPVLFKAPAGSILRIRVSAPGYREKLEFYEVGSEPKQRVEIQLDKKFLMW